MPERPRLEGKVAIVTGAGSSGPGIGNGKATSLLFAREGAKVLLVDATLERAEETQRMIREEGGEASVFQADMTNRGECQARAAAAMARWLSTWSGLNLARRSAACTFSRPSAAPRAAGPTRRPDRLFGRAARMRVSTIRPSSRSGASRWTACMAGLRPVSCPGLRPLPSSSTGKVRPTLAWLKATCCAPSSACSVARRSAFMGSGTCGSSPAAGSFVSWKTAQGDTTGAPTGRFSRPFSAKISERPTALDSLQTFGATMSALPPKADLFHH